MSEPISEPTGQPMSATWTPNAYPAVPPDAKFRQDLQRALEQTHRQQMAQRKIGAYAPARKLITPRRAAGVFFMLLALLLLARWVWNHDAHD